MLIHENIYILLITFILLKTCFDENVYKNLSGLSSNLLLNLVIYLKKIVIFNLILKIII